MISLADSTLARFALLGHPVTGSFSPVLHNAAFRAVGMNAVYETRDAVPGEFAAAFADARRRYRGINVTAPHKVEAAVLCDELSGEAGACGAVNTIVFRGRKAIGHNTDALAIRDLVVELAGSSPAVAGIDSPRGGAGGSSPRISRAAVLGAGGAARGAAMGLALAGAAEIIILARDPWKADLVSANLKRRSAARFAGAALADLDDAAEGCSVIIQATSAPDGTLRPPSSLSPGYLAVELNYRPLQTAFSTQALLAGAVSFGGLEVLRRQAQYAFRLFVGQEPPSGVMASALERAVGPAAVTAPDWGRRDGHDAEGSEDL